MSILFGELEVVHNVSISCTLISLSIYVYMHSNVQSFYLKANLCYLEGAWTVASSISIDELFQSDRHAIDARNFADLQVG